LDGGGEMGALLRRHDWSMSSLGPPTGWPQPLKTTIRLMLNTGHPMYIWWGPELLCFYNDAYRQSIGPEMHPGSLGRPGRIVWADIWHIIGPQIDQVMSGGGATWQENHLVPIIRNGKREDVYWTYSYSPIDDGTPHGGIGGVLVICTETTAQVVSARAAAEERQRFAELFEQAPSFMAMLRGPGHRVELVNPACMRLFGLREFVGRSVAEGLPEASSQGYVALLDEVYRTGQPYTARGAKFDVQIVPGGTIDERYLDFVYQPIKDTSGAVSGIFVEGVDVTDRTLADAAARDSEARFREIANAAPVLICITEPSGDSTWFNNPWLAFTGRSLEQEIGFGWAAGVHPDDRDRCISAYKDALDRREPISIDYRLRRHDGQWRVINDTGVPRFTADGVFIGYIGCGIDVTDQREATRLLQQSEEQLRLATEAAEVGLWDVDMLSDTLYWPPRVKAMFGISPDVPVSMADYYGGLHPDDFERTSAAFAAALDPALRALYDVEYRTVGKEDGVVRWVAAKGRGLFEGERCVRVLGTAIDITARKAAEEKLRELNDTLERRIADALAEKKTLIDIIESTDALLLVADLDRRLLALNRAAADAFQQVFGVRPRVGDSMLALLDNRPEHRDAVRAMWDRALAGEEFTAVEAFGDPSFDRRHYEIKFNSLRDRDGALVGAFQFVNDVTDRIRDQERLAKAESQLRQAQKIDAIGLLTGGVAHDFNNLLMVISGGLSLLHETDDFGRRHRVLHGMRQAADRGASLTRQLLRFSRRQPLKPEPLDLHEQITAMEELLDRALRGDVSVQTDLSEDLWAVEADPTELELVILNLCVNARDAMPDVRARNMPCSPDDGRSTDYVCLTVADTGVGMSEQVLAHIFEPFFTTKEIGQGSGLGLPQVYGFAQQSGGTVEVDSVLGKGTSVRLLLPRIGKSPNSRQSHEAESDARQASDALSLSVLLVEDDDEVAALVQEMLLELGCRITRARSAEAALGALADGRDIDLVFSDVMMPGSLNGVELGQEIQRRRPGLPVLLTSGYAGAALRQAGAQDIAVLTKPYQLSALEAAIREVCKRHLWPTA
jgi:PAS domain S-box-containing protein